MTLSFLKKHQQTRRKCRSSTSGKNITHTDKKTEKKVRFCESNIRSPGEKQDSLTLFLQPSHPLLTSPSNLNSSSFSSPTSIPEISVSSSVFGVGANRSSNRIVRRNTDLSFRNFFSAPLSPCFSDEEAFEDLMSPSSLTVLPTSPMSPLVSRTPYDPMTSLLTLSEYRIESQSTSSTADYCDNIPNPLFASKWQVPEQNQVPSTPSEFMFPSPRFGISKPLRGRLPEEKTAEFEATGKTRFPFTQLVPAWGRRNFPIPTQPPPPPTVVVLKPDGSLSSPSHGLAPVVRTSRPRPPSLLLAKPLPRMSAAPLDAVEEDDGSSIFSYYKGSPYYTTPSTSSMSHSFRAPSDTIDLQFKVDFESGSDSAVLLPVSPSDVEPDREGDFEQRLKQAIEQDEDDDHEPAGHPRAFRSRSSILSYYLQSPRTPSNLAVLEFKPYLRGPGKEGSTHRKSKRGVVILGPSTSTSNYEPTSPSAPFSVGARSNRFPDTPMSPRTPYSTVSLSPGSPSFSDAEMIALFHLLKSRSRMLLPRSPLKTGHDQQRW